MDSYAQPSNLRGSIRTLRGGAGLARALHCWKVERATSGYSTLQSDDRLAVPCSP